MSEPAAALLAAADRAVSAQNLSHALDLLRDAAKMVPDDIAIWMRLAGVSRAAGQPRIALDAVHHALALAPLDFTALLMRASLLDRLGDAGAGEAWGQALAQKPETALPLQISAAIAEGERRYAVWQDRREALFAKAMAAAEARADTEQRARIGRFRSNAVRRTRTYHSEPTHFHFPGLVEREFHPRRLFPWMEALEAATDIIAAEFEAVMVAERRELVPYIQYPGHLPLRQWASLNCNSDWSAIHLWQNGNLIEANATHCPQTLALLERIGQPAVPAGSPNAMFSLLAPGAAIPPHVGVSNTRLVCHLPLVVPEGCWFRVGAETRYWQRGEAFVFDDTIEHEALNPSKHLRVVFIFDLWHPDLGAPEREAIAALAAADGSGGAL